MLVGLKEILKLKGTGEAIGCFNTPNIASLKAVIGAAETLGRPVIVAHAEVHEKFVPVEIIGAAMIAAAKHAKVPVCVHLDHGVNLEYCLKAIDIGFTGVMFDGSLLPYEENIRNTKTVVNAAHKKGASVEAELGTINRHETAAEAAAIKQADVYTDPAVAEDFVKKTGVDALAVTFGTAHGIYFKEPVLDFKRLEEINRRIDTPLVMHGGSGLSDEKFRKAIELGIEKVNYYTYMAKAGGQAAKEWIEKNDPLFFHDIELASENAMRENVIKAMKIFSNIL